MSNSVQLHGQQPTRLLCPWGSPGKNTGVGCYFLLHHQVDTGILPWVQHSSLADSALMYLRAAKAILIDWIEIINSYKAL